MTPIVADNYASQRLIVAGEMVPHRKRPNSLHNNALAISLVHCSPFD
jgi:hypothetical protein